MNTKRQLLEEHARQSQREWIKAASAEIKGADAFETLAWSTPDRLTFKPYYDLTDVSALHYLEPFCLPDASTPVTGTRHWHNVPSITVIEEHTANQIALMHLKHGADGVIFSLRKSNPDFETLLADIEWPFCSISFLMPDDSGLSDLEAWIRKKNYQDKLLPGALFFQRPSLQARSLSGVSGFRNFGLFVPTTTPVEEIASALALAVQYIDLLQDAGMAPSATISRMAFSIPVGQSLLIEVSKLKALRILWYQVAQAYGLTEYAHEHVHIHARSEPWIHAAYQPHGNLLKSTVAAMAAVAGGCDALTILPEEETSTMAQRIARNTSIILHEESHFGKVADPFAGAYVHEALVDQTARAAWKKFQTLLSDQ